jgi:hypothetical protein
VYPKQLDGGEGISKHEKTDFKLVDVQVFLFQGRKVILMIEELMKA